MRRLLTTILLSCCVAAHAAERWVYAPCNYLVDAQADRLVALMQRAKASGYTHFMLTDSKFARLPQMPKRYFANVEKVKAAAAGLGVELVPNAFGIGYSNDLLASDPNLAEGLPVRDALFVVKDFIASHVPDPEVSLKDSALVNRKAWNFIDDNLVADGGAMRSDATDRNARLSQRVRVMRFRQYHVSARLKTQDFTGGVAEIKVMTAAGAHLNYTCLPQQPTQDWKSCDITFNSLDNNEVVLYFGVWGGHQGTLWWKQPQMEECGPVNVLRRPGAPLVVRTEDGRELKERVDYEPLADPKLGTVPYAGEYEPWHEPPSIRVKDLPDGTRLRVSYFHPHVINGGQMCPCVSDPGFQKLIAREAGGVRNLWGATGYMMGYDEWRVMDWDRACVRRHLTPGQVVADSARTSTALLKSLAPGARLFAWNDMFDPFHNARDHYYLVNGDLAGAWEGLDKGVIIVNWNSGEAAKSLKFFADRGHQQLIAGYYDSPVARTERWLASSKGVPGVIGVMYTTWKNNYKDLEAFAQMLDKAGF